MSEIETNSFCIALTKEGNRCKNHVVEGTEYCHLHIPASLRPAPNGPSGSSGSSEKLTDREMRRELMAQLDELIVRVKALNPEYRPPSFSAQGLVDLVDESSNKLPAPIRLGIYERLRGAINEDLMDAETWKGIWYMVNYTLDYQGDILKRRLKGDYETDDWGLDWEFVEAMRPFLDFMYKVYWRVETSGIAQIPDYDRAMLVCNHSGQLPWDAVMVMAAVLNEHPAQRLVRNLYAKWFPTLPFLSSALVKMGQVLATFENGTRLLEQDELVGVFPEGDKGVGKLYKNRYKLARFGRGRFVKMAIKSGAPIIPVSIVGGEETSVTIAKSPTLARLIGFPYFPVSLRFPWFGLLGIVPYPTKWYIDFGEAIPVDEYDAAETKNLVLISQLTDQVRNVIQEMVNDRLSKRKSIFY